MEAVEISVRYLSVNHQAATIEQSRPVYDQLVSLFGELGSEVRRDRVLERDIDIRPYAFIRNAMHEFIFPKQDVTLSEDHPEILRDHPDYLLRAERTKSIYDRAQVRGHLRLLYDDAGHAATMSIADLMEDSELPERITTILKGMRQPTAII